MLIAGYKVQVVASVLFVFILLTRAMRANVPDGQALPGMLDALRARGFLPKGSLATTPMAPWPIITTSSGDGSRARTWSCMRECRGRKTATD